MIRRKFGMITVRTRRVGVPMPLFPDFDGDSDADEADEADDCDEDCCDCGDAPDAPTATRKKPRKWSLRWKAS